MIIGNRNRNCEIVEASIESIWNNKEYDRIPEFYTEDFFCHPTGIAIFPSWKPGHLGVKERIENVKNAFPDYRETPTIVFGEGDLVIVRQDVSGTNSGNGPFGGVAGVKFDVVDMMICRLKDGRLCEQWGLTDRYTQFVQLGLIKSSL